MPASYRGNLGNLLQHWTWVEVLTALQASSAGEGCSLQFMDAHAMAPLAPQGDRPFDSDFSRVASRIASRAPLHSSYEKSWRELTSNSPSHYPSTAAFTAHVWRGPLNLVLCERDPETADALRRWLASTAVLDRTSGAELYFGDWRDRFRQGLEPTGDLAALSFDPFMFNNYGPLSDNAHMWPSDIELIGASLHRFLCPTILQISTYTANNGNPQKKIIPLWDEGFKQAGFARLTLTAPNGNMMTALFARGMTSQWEASIKHRARSAHFLNWIAM